MSDTKERYKLHRSSPIVIKFPVEIDDIEYDKLRAYLYEIFPISLIEQYSSRIVIAIVPEGMIPAAKEIKKFFADASIIIDEDNYDIYIERRNKIYDKPNKY